MMPTNPEGKAQPLQSARPIESGCDFASTNPYVTDSTYPPFLSPKWGRPLGRCPAPQAARHDFASTNPYVIDSTVAHGKVASGVRGPAIPPRSDLRARYSHAPSHPEHQLAAGPATVSDWSITPSFADSQALFSARLTLIFAT